MFLIIKITHKDRKTESTEKLAVEYCVNTFAPRLKVPLGESQRRKTSSIGCEKNRNDITALWEPLGSFLCAGAFLCVLSSEALKYSFESLIHI